MYYGRILAILGVVAAVVGFLLKKASSAGEQAMAALNQANPAIPPNLDENTWSALYNDTAWAAIVYAIAAVAAAIVVFTPPLKEPMKRLYGLIASALGVLMLIIGIFSTMGAMDDADTLEAGFAQAFSRGSDPRGLHGVDRMGLVPAHPRRRARGHRRGAQPAEPAERECGELTRATSRGRPDERGGAAEGPPLRRVTQRVSPGWSHTTGISRSVRDWYTS